jgi:hypothetical protein
LFDVRKAVTFRFDPDLLERARVKAREENRTLTNFIETVVKNEVDGDRVVGESVDPSARIVRRESSNESV